MSRAATFIRTARNAPCGDDLGRKTWYDPPVRLSFLAAAVAVVLVLLPGIAGGSQLAPLSVPRELHVVSYYPRDAGWTAMWTKWDPARVASDLDHAVAVDANTVRAIVQPDTFGYPHVSPVYASRLSQFVTLAAARGLHVQLTLFDWWYSWYDRRGSQTWARELLAPYAHDARIAFIELRNEILPKQETTAWATEMIPFVRRLVPGTPLTLSVAGPNLLGKLATLKRQLGAVRPDFYDIHYFGLGGESAFATFARAKQIVAPTPLWVGETGYPTLVNGSGFGGVPRTRAGQEVAQTQFLSTVAWAAHANGLAPIGVWQLGDLDPDAVPDRLVDPEEPELHYGLFRADGSAKPAAETVRSIFGGSVPTSFNNGFEDSLDGVPARWEMAGDGIWFAVDHSVAATGAASGEIAGAGTASYSIVPPNGGVRSGTRISASVFARRAAPGGSVSIVLEWHDRAGRLLGRETSPPLAAVGAWSQLAASGTAPRKGAYVRIDLVAHGLTAPVWFDDVVFSRS
jgi:hypothetical protein